MREKPELVAYCACPERLPEPWALMAPDAVPCNRVDQADCIANGPASPAPAFPSGIRSIVGTGPDTDQGTAARARLGLTVCVAVGMGIAVFAIARI